MKFTRVLKAYIYILRVKNPNRAGCSDMSKALTLKSSMLLATLVLSVVFAAYVIHINAQASVPTVRIEPLQTDNVPIGSSFTVYVWVDNAADIEAAQIQFTYDSAILNATSVVEGPFMRSAGQTIVSQAMAEPVGDTGMSEVYYSSAGISMNTASGSGILLNVTFTVLADGSTTFHMIPFVSASIGDGCYFLDLNSNNIVPNLIPDAFYGIPITLHASSSLINVGDSVTLNGTISGSSTVNITGLELIYRSLLENNWTTLASVPIDASHNFVYHWTSTESGTFAFAVSFVLENSTHTSRSVEVAVQPVIHGYGIYVLYAFVIVMVAFIGTSLFLGIRERRRRAAEAPPL